MIRIMTWCLLLLTMAGTTLADERSDLLQTLGRQLQAGDHPAALRTARQYIEIDRTNQAVYYNLAGLEMQHGSRARSLSAFRQAVALGFDDFRFADQDQDLGGLTQDPGYLELRRAWADGLRVRTKDRALTVEAGLWSESFDLADRQGGLSPPAASARLMMEADGLAVEMFLESKGVAETPPWLPGGGGVLATILVPENPLTGEGQLAVDFGFGMNEGMPAGAIRLGNRWQRIAELTPKFRMDPDTGRLGVNIQIPWSTAGIMHPLVDIPLGVNLVFLRQETGDEPGRAAWIADPAIGRTLHPWRRGIPVTCGWPASEAPALQARARDLVIRDRQLILDSVALVSEDNQPADVHFVVRDRDSNVAHDSYIRLEGPAGLRQMPASLDVDLPPGSVRLGVSHGGLSAWEATLVSLPAGWEEATSVRIATAPLNEQPSLQYRLDAVIAELSSRLPREHVGALSTTVDELEAMLAIIEATGTSLPAGGPFLAVVPGLDDRPNRRCHLAIPDGWSPGDPVEVLLLLIHAPGAANRALNLAPRLLAEKAQQDGVEPPRVVLAIPDLGPTLPPDVARAEARHILTWLKDLLGCGPVHLSGVDLLGATALEVAMDQGDDVAGVLVFSGMNFVPYPEDDQAALTARFADLDTGLKTGWIWFSDEQLPGDQAYTMRKALRDHGLTISPSRSVKGGLNFSQAWSRALLWAAGLAK